MPKITINITIDDNCNRINVIKVDLIKKITQNTIIKVCGKRFEDYKFALNIRFSDAKTIQEYNLLFLNNNKSTDVISFPSIDSNQKKWSDIFIKNKDNELGDIIFSNENVEVDAKEIGITVKNRMIHLLYHSILHLLGFDHIEESEATTMEELEKQLLKLHDIQDPYELK